MNLKLNIQPQTIEDSKTNLSEIKKLVKHYNKLTNPKNETDNNIRLQLEYINRLEINVAFPFLMKVYDDYIDSTIDKQTFIEVLDLIQSFTWRRFIVGLDTKALNKTFMNLYEKVNTFRLSVLNSKITTTKIRFSKISQRYRSD